MTTAPVMTIDDAVVAELEAIMDEPGSVLTGVSSRANRARVPAPFPVHRWAEHMPAVVVLPRTASRCRRSSSWPTAPGSRSYRGRAGLASTTEPYRFAAGFWST